MNVELRHLKYFLAVADTLHFGKAAKKLFIAQPPLSRQIKQLENELGVILLYRDKRKVSLTPQGEYFYKEAQKIFSHIESIKRSLSLINKGIVGQINIGYIGAAMHSILPAILVKLRETYEDVHTVLFELNNNEQVEALNRGQIDIGFIRTPINAKGLIVETIYCERFSLVLPFDYNYDGSERKVLKSLADKPFISFSKTCGPSLINSINNICNKCGFSPNIVHRTDQINSIIRLVESGLGYSNVPSSVEKSYNLKVNFIELSSFSETSDLSIVHKNNDLKPIVNNFLNVILDWRS